MKMELMLEDHGCHVAGQVGSIGSWGRANHIGGSQFTGTEKAEGPSMVTHFRPAYSNDPWPAESAGRRPVEHEHADTHKRQPVVLK